MPNQVAKIMVYGDIHLSSRNYGGHINYPNETLEILKNITNKCEELGVTHLIGTGDFSFDRFKNLEYRESVEKELEKQYNLTNGNRYELKGNHDTAGYGMTEYEYYIRKGLIKPSMNMQIGGLNLSMIDYNKYNETDVLISEDKYNLIIMHNFFKFEDTRMADYGAALKLDDFEKWYGADYIIGGHIHNSEVFEGLMVKNIDGQAHGHRAVVDYLGCMSRPAYREGHMDEFGHLMVITVNDDGNCEFERLDIQLKPINECFNLDLKDLEIAKKIDKEKRVDISDIVHQLDEHERNVGNPEEIIMDLSVDNRYKLKAIQLLKDGQS